MKGNNPLLTPMILSILRIMDTGDLSSLIVCTDTDFHIAMEMIKVFVQRASFVLFHNCSRPSPCKRSIQKWHFINPCRNNSTEQDIWKLPSLWKFLKVQPTNKLQGLLSQTFLSEMLKIIT